MHLASAAPEAAKPADPAAAAPAGGVRPPTDDEVKTVQSVLAELDREPDKILADVGPRQVTKADVAAEIRLMPGFEASRPATEIFQTGVALAIQRKALAVRAVNAGLDKIPSVEQRMRAAAEDAMADAYLRATLNANLTDEVFHRAYDALVAGKPGPTEVKARIIATATEQSAQVAIGLIQGGASFDAIARSDSIDGTASKGGDMGYVQPTLLAPELAAVLFTLDVGAMTAHPVKSGDHWFVLKSEGRRVAAAPSFEEVRPLLARDLGFVEAQRIKQDAIAGATVVYHGVLAEAPPAAQAK